MSLPTVAASSRMEPYNARSSGTRTQTVSSSLSKWPRRFEGASPIRMAVTVHLFTFSLHLDHLDLCVCMYVRRVVATCALAALAPKCPRCTCIPPSNSSSPASESAEDLVTTSRRVDARSFQKGLADGGNPTCPLPICSRRRFHRPRGTFSVEHVGEGRQQPQCDQRKPHGSRSDEATQEGK